MAQFDVHRNKGPLQDSIPFVVVVQSSLYDRYRRRMMVPLVRRSVLPEQTNSANTSLPWPTTAKRLLKRWMNC